MGQMDYKAWLIAEQLKSLERAGLDGYIQYARLKKQYHELTGEEWQGEANHKRNSTKQ